jgi:ketosteroid isomerase-like protein
MEHGVRREIVKNALRQLEVQLRGRDVEGVVALFREDGVLFGSEEHENAAGAKQLRVFLSGLFARPHTYGWSELEPLFTGGNDELVWFVAPTTVIIQEDEGHEKTSAISGERGARPRRRRPLAVPALQRLRASRRRVVEAIFHGF